MTEVIPISGFYGGDLSKIEASSRDSNIFTTIRSETVKRVPTHAKPKDNDNDNNNSSTDNSRPPPIVYPPNVRATYPNLPQQLRFPAGSLPLTMPQNEQYGIMTLNAHSEKERAEKLDLIMNIDGWLNTFPKKLSHVNLNPQILKTMDVKQLRAIRDELCHIVEISNNLYYPRHFYELLLTAIENYTNAKTQWNITGFKDKAMSQDFVDMVNEIALQHQMGTRISPIYRLAFALSQVALSCNHQNEVYKKLAAVLDEPIDSEVEDTLMR